MDDQSPVARLSAADLTSPEDGESHLRSASFQGLLWTQFLGAANDNILRWLVIGIGKQYVATENINTGTILMAGTICFVLPFLLLAAPAGFLADRYSKRTVIVACKMAEIAIMFLAVLVIWSGSLWLLFVVVALMGSQSALFGPAKLGSIPEMLNRNRISAANGLVGLTTVIATVVGMAVGNLLSDFTQPRGAQNLHVSALVLIGVSVIGWVFSLGIKPLSPADPTRTFPFNAVPQMIRDLRLLASSRPLLRVALGLMFFWALAALAQLNIDQFAAESGTTTQRQVIPLLLSLVVGVGLGSVLAGYWSAGRVELGILPLGAAGIAISSILLFSVQETIVDFDAQWTAGFVWASFFLFLLGCSAGMFDVPLKSYLQHHSPRHARGSILAACNLLTFTGILISALLFAGMRVSSTDGAPLMSARQIFLVCGFLTIPVLIYIVCLIPQSSIRFVVWLASKTVYRIRVYGGQHLPTQGGALLVPNHVSWLDGILLLLISARPIRMVVYAGNFQNRVLLWLGKLWDVILLPTQPKAMLRTFESTRQALIDGQLVCIFPEGGITKSGQLQAFKPGVMKIHEGTNVPIIPIYFDELWGSIFSFERGRFFWKWPRRWPYPISIHIGQPMHQPADVHAIRQNVQQLGARAVHQRTTRTVNLSRQLVQTCKAEKFRWKIADSSGARLTGGSLLTRTLILRRLLLRHVLSPDERYVGVLVPPSAGAVVANAALAVSNRVAVNLNYTVSCDVMNQCIDQCNMQHVLTSRRFLDKLNSMGLPTDQLNAELVCLEDFRDQVTTTDKISSALAAYLMPARLLQYRLRLHEIQRDDELTIIFTSGSTGLPKGVMLTHANVASNVQAIEKVVRLSKEDVLLGVLPFFHSFGYTVTLWTALTLLTRGVYHFSPLDAKQIGKLCKKHGGTILLVTPTFLRSYLRRCDKEDLASLDVVVAGAEKLPSDLADAFENKFGVRPVEGYGATELSPLASVNIPPTRSTNNTTEDLKEGSVGRPVPGVSAKIVHLESGQELGANQPGMLLIRGPNVMKGYLNQPSLTSEVIRDGWYVTGDVAMIDDDGFITITGRESRFSKIGGEMVPHIQIEETLVSILRSEDDLAPMVAVTAIPDVKKGEKLVVVHTALPQSPQQLCEGLASKGLPNIFIPSPDSFIEVQDLPVLGSGKLDLKNIKEIALKHFAKD